MKKVSIIDIGTQSIKHHIFSLAENSKTLIYCKRYSDANLGDNWEIYKEAIDRNISILNECMHINIEQGIKEIIATGTQILRTASNAQYFSQKVKDIFWFDIKILSHEDEAFYLYKWLLNIINNLDFAAANIWWWSTEIIISTNKTLEKSIKIEIGVKTLKTRFQDISTDDIDWTAMKKYLDKNIHVWEIQKDSFFITWILDFYLTVAPTLWYQFNQSEIINHPIFFDIKTMENFIQTLKETDIKMLKNIYNKDPSFVDGVIIGQTLYCIVAKKLWAKKIYPSRNDLTDGLLLETS